MKRYYFRRKIVTKNVQFDEESLISGALKEKKKKKTFTFVRKCFLGNFFFLELCMRKESLKLKIENIIGPG